MRSAIVVVLTLLLAAMPAAGQRQVRSAAAAASALGLARPAEPDAPSRRPGAPAPRECDDACGLTSRAVLGYTGAFGGVLVGAGLVRAICGQGGSQGCDNGMVAPVAALMSLATAAGVSMAAESAGDRPAWPTTIGASVIGGLMLFSAARADDGQGDMGSAALAVLATPVLAIYGNYYGQ